MAVAMAPSGDAVCVEVVCVDILHLLVVTYFVT